GINSSTTSIDVNAVGDLEVDDYAMIDDEIIKITSISGTTLTIERGKSFSVASSHSSGDFVNVILPPPEPDNIVTHSECKNYHGSDMVGMDLAEFGSSEDGFFTTDKTYFYGITLVYDGFQE